MIIEMPVRSGSGAPDSRKLPNVSRDLVTPGRH